MKKLTIKTVLAGVLITSSMMLSCNDVTTSFPDVDYVPFKFSENDDWGLISVDGEPLFEDMFKEMPSISVNGVFATTNDKGEVIYYISDKNPKQIGSDSYIYGGCYSEGVIPVVKQEQPISFINKEGKEVLSLSAVEGKRITAVNAYFSDGLMTFCTEDNKYGYINAQGNVVVKPIYDDAFPFNEGVALVKKNDKYLIINTSGKETVELKQDLKDGYLNIFFEGLLTNGNKIFDNKGELAFRTSSKWEHVYPYSNGCAIYEEDDSYGLIDKKGEIVIKAKYDYGIKKYGNYYIGINESKGKGINVQFLDEDKNELKELEDIQNFKVFKPDRSVVMEQDEYYFVNDEGEAIDKNNYYCVYLPDRWSFYNDNNTNTLFLSYLYHSINRNDDCRYWIRSDFYPAEEAVSSVLDALTPNGVGNIQLGASLQEVMKYYSMRESDAYLYEYWSNFEGVKGIENLRSNYSIQFDDWISNYYGYNDNARVKHVIINIDKSSVYCSNSEQRIYNAILGYLERIGFVKSGHNDNWMDEEWDIYKSNAHSYLIAVNSDGSKLCLENK